MGQEHVIWLNLGHRTLALLVAALLWREVDCASYCGAFLQFRRNSEFRKGIQITFKKNDKYPLQEENVLPAPGCV